MVDKSCLPVSAELSRAFGSAEYELLIQPPDSPLESRLTKPISQSVRLCRVLSSLEPILVPMEMVPNRIFSLKGFRIVTGVEMIWKVSWFVLYNFTDCRKRNR